MITKIVVKGFKSLEKVELELGNLNVFVGANGSGKSNLLEAIGVLSAAADGKVNDQNLLQRGVRPGVPKLYKSAFKSKAAPHIYFSAFSEHAHYDVSLDNPLNDPSPSWKFKTERFREGSRKIASRSPNTRDDPNKENGWAALEMAKLDPARPAAHLMARLQRYVIFTPSTAVLRGVALDHQPLQPVGLSGGRLPEAVSELLRADKSSGDSGRTFAEILDLIDWVQSFDSAPAAALPLSPAARGSSQVIRFRDRFMRDKRNVLSGYDASEGALYVLFLAVLAKHPSGPLFFGIDNADHGLNPGLAKALTSAFARWLMANPRGPQVLMTSHNPAVLDGLPLQDDGVRLFAVDRDHAGKTVVRRVELTDKLRRIAVQKDWPLSRLWMNKLIGGMPSV